MALGSSQSKQNFTKHTKHSILKDVCVCSCVCGPQRGEAKKVFSLCPKQMYYEIKETTAIVVVVVVVIAPLSAQFNKLSKVPHTHTHTLTHEHTVTHIYMQKAWQQLARA